MQGKKLLIIKYSEVKESVVYIKGYMGKLEFMRLKYPKERKRKINIFYNDMKYYFQEVYEAFENYWITKITDIEPKNEDFLEYNKEFRKKWKVK